MLGEERAYRIVESEIRGLLDRRGLPSEVSQESAIAELGVDSLMLAELLVQLESELGVDPFQEKSITEVATLGELGRAYAAALADSATASG